MDARAPRLLVVTPAHDEAEHLDRTARAVAAQTRPPDRWVVVDDGSSDATAAIARRWARTLPYLTVTATPPRTAAASADRLALALEARALNHGLRTAGWGAFDLIGKLDGDVELPPDWFAVLAEALAADPRLGIVGGRLREPGPRGWGVIPIPDHHVHGAVKLWRRACLEDIGGVPERLAWDTIDETYARMRGWRTRSLPGLVARHHRPHASAQGRLRGRARHGACAWMLHHPPAWAALKAVREAGGSPPVLSGAAYAFGYGAAALRREPQVGDAAFRHFVRAELRARVRTALEPA